MMDHLKIGAKYLFDHERKGVFVAEFKGKIPTENGDIDPFLLEVDIYTEDGSGQERLANSLVRDHLGRKVRPPISTKLLRPSLLKSISAPPVDSRPYLHEQFKRARELAIKAGQEVSLPTVKTMERMNTKPWWKIWRNK